MRDVIQALGLPRDAVVQPASGGASGSAWKVRASGEDFVLRVSTSVVLADGRLAAMAAARRAGLPAPKLVARASVAGREAMLLSWLPGITLSDATRRQPNDASRWGRQMGEMQRRLHAVAAPAGVVAVVSDDQRPFSAGRDVPGLPAGDSLLHLDWHALNLLVDADRGEICGIVDWDNARRGHPALDLARTHGILTLDPALATLPDGLRAALATFRDAWADGYGPAARAIPAACHTWAAQVMLADLEPRYAATPEALDRIRASAQRQ